MIKTWNNLDLGIVVVALLSSCIDDDFSSNKNLKLKTVRMGGQCDHSSYWGLKVYKNSTVAVLCFANLIPRLVVVEQLRVFKHWCDPKADFVILLS